MAISCSRGLRAISSNETPLNSSCRCKVGRAARLHFESDCFMRFVPAISGFASSADAAADAAADADAEADAEAAVDDAGMSAKAKDCLFTRVIGGISNAGIGYCGPIIEPDAPDGN